MLFMGDVVGGVPRVRGHPPPRSEHDHDPASSLRGARCRPTAKQDPPLRNGAGSAPPVQALLRWRIARYIPRKDRGAPRQTLASGRHARAPVWLYIVIPKGVFTTQAGRCKSAWRRTLGLFARMAAAAGGRRRSSTTRRRVDGSLIGVDAAKTRDAHRTRADQPKDDPRRDRRLTDRDLQRATSVPGVSVSLHSPGLTIDANRPRQYRVAHRSADEPRSGNVRTGCDTRGAHRSLARRTMSMDRPRQRDLDPTPRPAVHHAGGDRRGALQRVRQEIISTISPRPTVSRDPRSAPGPGPRPVVGCACATARRHDTALRVQIVRARHRCNNAQRPVSPTTTASTRARRTLEVRRRDTGARGRRVPRVSRDLPAPPARTRRAHQQLCRPRRDRCVSRARVLYESYVHPLTILSRFLGVWALLAR